MSVNKKLRRGLDIRMKGRAEKILVQAEPSELYALKPIDFPNLTPKLSVKVNDRVKAGEPLFFDKYRPEVLFTSPVSGTVVSVTRGERRRILEVVIGAEPEIEYKDFKTGSIEDLSREKIISILLESGAWPYIRQRPYGIVADPGQTPKSIFISGFDSAPLAPDLDFIMQDQGESFQKGIELLKKLTPGKVHLGIHANNTHSPVLKNAQGVQINRFSGPHPSGNVGIQIHHVDPVNKGETVWYVQPQDLVIIGRLFEKGVYDATRIIALTGSEVEKPRYFRIVSGACIKNLVSENVTPGELRYISGNVLTGKKILSEGYVGFYDNQVTVIPEGNYHEFFGWATPGFSKFSTSRTYFSWLMPGKEYRVDTNLHGGERAFVMTGEYERVTPMDIYPVQLLKSILIEDIDKMENLGIYEVVEEDLALCEFACTSKIDVQKIVREGINLMIKELG
jgi:Na+-transporting NADH:ubiquinone oxidoreductase subunit A